MALAVGSSGCGDCGDSDSDSLLRGPTATPMGAGTPSSTATATPANGSATPTPAAAPLACNENAPAENAPLGPDVPPLVVSQYRTPNGWLLRPAGRQIDTPRATTGVAVSPDRRRFFAVNSGIFDHQIVTVDALTFAKGQAPVSDLYQGVVADDGTNVWASGGSRNKVYHFASAGPVSVNLQQVGLIPGQPDAGIPVIGYPGNMVLGPDARLYVAGNLSIPESELAARGDEDTCPAGLPADGPVCSVVNVISLSNAFEPEPAVGFVPVGRDAYGIAVHPTAGKVYVTNWADETNPDRAGGAGTLSVVDVSTPGSERELAAVAVGQHPTGLALSPPLAGGLRRLAVTNSASDTITLLDLDAAGNVTSTDTKSMRTTPEAPRAATPIAAAFSSDGRFLFVALAGQNAVEVLTAGGDPIPRRVTVGEGPDSVAVDVPHTYIPTGWYPVAMASAYHPESAHMRLYVANLKGIGAGPGQNAQAAPTIGSRTQGSVSAIEIPCGAGPRDALFDEWTATVVENNHWASLFDPRIRSAASDPCEPAPLPGGGTTLSGLLCAASRGEVDPRPLHVVFILKENKTFDQFFGDLAPPFEADADPSFLLYGRDVTTNQHRLAEQFSLSDNFWADSEASTTGHMWTSAGYTTEFVEITWNTEYDQGLRGNRGGGQFSGQFVDAASASAIAEIERALFEPEERFVDLLADPARNPRGLTFRIYSDDVNDETSQVVKDSRVPLPLWGLGASSVNRGRDLDFPDTDRANLFTHGFTVSHAWSFCGVPCTGAPNPPPPSLGKEIGFCGAGDGDPAVANHPDGGFCAREGASPNEHATFSLAAWEEAYEQCRAGGGSDAECQRAMPNFIYMALPVDHTLGFNPLSPTPQSMVADNDHATGLIVDALSRSPFWKNTLILVTEDDTQLAGDHVDAHRTFLIAAGGLARRHGPNGKASHQGGSFPSILKTIGVLLGLPPITIYDRGAVPLHDLVVNSLAEANDATYSVVAPSVPFFLNPFSPAPTSLGQMSLKLDWRLDRADPCALTGLVYHGLKGWPLPECALALANLGP